MKFEVKLSKVVTYTGTPEVEAEDDEAAGEAAVVKAEGETSAHPIVEWELEDERYECEDVNETDDED